MTTDWSRVLRYASIVVIVGTLVATAGCTALGDAALPGDDGDEATASDADGENASATADESDADAEESDDHEDDDGHDHDGHDHGGGETGHSVPDSSDADASGLMTVVVAGEELSPVQEPAASRPIWFDDQRADVWYRTDEAVTVAEALSQAYGVEVTGDTLTNDGTTYRDDDDGTSIEVRVNGRTVDPTTHELEDGDEVWVTVETAEMDVDVPGEYISADEQHVHGTVEFVVEGEEVDFSEDRYQSGHRHFHFEGGHANPWHAHSWSVTLEYAMSTLDGITVSDGEITYDGTTYDANDPGTEVTVEVNGDPVDPGEYYLKDGDSVRIVVEQ